MIRALQLGDRLAQQGLLRPRPILEHDEAQPFVGLVCGPVVGLRGRGEPALVDAATFAAERIVVVRVQLDAPPGMQNDRGTQFGASRRMPSPCSTARSAISLNVHCLLLSS